MKKQEDYEEIKCHDCGNILKENDECMTYEVGDEVYVKCRACHEKDPVLRNFRETEIYSRIVGYIRAIKGWNPGKIAEFKDRKTFKNKNDKK